MDRLERAPNALWRQAGGVLVVARADRPDEPPVAITGAGSIIWLALERPRAPDELDALAASVSDVPADEARDALHELLDLLERHDLVQRVP